MPTSTPETLSYLLGLACTRIHLYTHTAGVHIPDFIITIPSHRPPHYMFRLSPILPQTPPLLAKPTPQQHTPCPVHLRRRDGSL